MKNKLDNLSSYGILGLVSLLACAGFLVISQLNAGLGFPLDDAWIHQTFARNFAGSLTWSFQLGTPSGGSTGPLWGLMLSLFHLTGVNIVLGTHFLGFLLLWACSIIIFKIGRNLFPTNHLAALLLGSIVAVEWHLVWSALSGMETILLIFISLIVFYWILEQKENWWLPGLLIGISIWIRPDGLTLIGPILLYLITRKDSPRKALINGVAFFGCIVLIAGPYFVFNYYVAGDFWPNTFYAKQAEYAVLRQASLFSRFTNLSQQLVTGIGSILVPGVLIEILNIFHKKDWKRMGILIWAIGYIGVYALRLPVVYQHGRYVIPAMPVFLLLGSAGLLRWIEIRSEKMWKRILSASWSGVAAIVALIFYGLGARAYAFDVGVIETEMVRVAHWVEENTPETAVIGAHDIGGLGYFGDREILDLAGLVSPDVIPFIRDEEQLAEYLDERGADYLITFPSWYPALVKDLQPIFESGGEYSERFDMDQMTVYRWEAKRE
jgi:hypothetical protein